MLSNDRLLILVYVIRLKVAKRKPPSLDESELQRDEVVGVDTQLPLSGALQGAVDGHGTVVLQPERVGRERRQSLSVQHNRSDRPLRDGNDTGHFMGRPRARSVGPVTYITAVPSGGLRVDVGGGGGVILTRLV